MYVNNRSAKRACGGDFGSQASTAGRDETFLTSLDLPSHTSPLVFIDEIGRMECLSQRFVRFAEMLLSSKKTVVATVARQGEGLIREVKLRPGSRLVEVTSANRQALPEELGRWLENRLVCCR